MEFLKECILLSIKSNIGNLIFGVLFSIFFYYPLRVLIYKIYKRKNLRIQQNLIK